MKLINRDKFISDMFDLYIEQKWKPRDIHFSLLDVRNNIDFKGYEVKAIPIEWIEEWGWKNGMSESMSLRVMIDDWEKENAQRENSSPEL